MGPATKLRQGDESVDLKPKKEVQKGRSVYLRPSVWEEIERVSDESRRDDPEGKGLSQNQIISQIVDWGLAELRAKKKAKK